MSKLHAVTLAFRLLKRDWRAGELLILTIALIVAVAGSSTIILFADRINRTMEAQAAEFMGADLLVHSHQPAPSDWDTEAKQLGLEQASITEFTSVLVNNAKTLLTSVKAVSSAYPLHGEVKISKQGITEQQVAKNIPLQGNVWVDQRVLTELDLRIGDTVQVGQKKLNISYVLTHEPDRRGDFYSLSPRVMINLADLKATAVVQPGSRVHYLSLYAGAEEPVLEMKSWLEPRLEPGQRISDVYEDRPELGNALTRAEQYLGLASVVVVLISGVAIAMAARRYGIRHYDMTALLRCFGAGQNDVMLIYLTQIVIAGLIASLVGLLLGWVGHIFLMRLLSDLLPAELLAPGATAIFLSFQTGFLVLFGFSILPLLRQKQVSPIKVLRRDFAPAGVSVRAVAAVASIVLLLLLWQYTENLSLTLTIFAGGVGLSLLMFLAGTGLLKFLQHVAHRVPLPWRLGVRAMTHHKGATLSQILSFSVTLMAMILIILVRTDLLNDWKSKLPADAPNFFAINIFETDVVPLADKLEEVGAKASEIYPIVRGRLIQINGDNVQKIVSKESEGERAVNRELSLTWSNHLPADNDLVEGDWYGPDDKGHKLVSIEEKLAESLGVSVGDELRFSVSGQEFSAKVASIRSVQWDTMKPNFYMVFNEGVLEDYPKTYLTSFYLSDSAKAELAQLASAFPAMTLLDVDAILKQVRSLFDIVSMSVEFILIFAITAGFLVLLASVYASYDARLYDSVMMRALGAQRRTLQAGLLVEFVGTGLVSGLIAALMAEVFTFIIYQIVLKMPYAPSFIAWLITPLISAIVVGVAGFYFARGVIKISPMRLLRDAN